MGTVSKSVDGLFASAPVTAADRLLLSASRYGSIMVLTALITGVAVTGTLAVRDLQSTNEEVQKIHQNAMVGMQRVGELQYDAQETRRTILYALTTSDSNLQLDYADQTRAADQRVRDGIEQYAANVEGPEEDALARRLGRDWTSYLLIRDEVLASILEGSIDDAVKRDLSVGVPAFERVRQDLLNVKRLYGERLKRSNQRLSASWRNSALRLGGIVSFTFLLSSVAVWCIQRSQLLGRTQVARLQMEFVALVSHELRTPVAVIQSAADNLADGIVRGNEETVRYGSILQRQSRAIAELVDQILLFAATKVRPRAVEVEPISSAAIIRAASAQAEVLAGNSGFRFDFTADPDLPDVYANLDVVNHVMTNILTNAKKYGGADKLISISASAAASGDEVRFSVTDRGIGIDSAEINRIFEPFYRSPRVQIAQIHGTGLGLAVAQSMAESMGGRITVSSRPGDGSTFSLHLASVRKPELFAAAFDLPDS